MFKKLWMATCLLLLTAWALGQIQTAVNLTATITGANSRGFYRQLPTDYNSSTKKYPLLLWVHGAGQVGQGNVADLPKVLEWGTPKLISEGGFPTSFIVGDSSFSFIVISPQFIVWPTGNNLGAMLDYITANYRVDADRIYVMGISAGGGAAWQYAGANTANGNRLAAIIPFCGALFPTQTEAYRIAAANLPVWAFHNTNDGTVPVSYSRNWKNYINSYSPRPSPIALLTEFPVVSSNAVTAHECWSLATLPSYKPAGINIYEWLLQYKKRTSNTLPFASAGDDAAVALPGSLSLVGSASTDADGNIVTYSWRKISGPVSFTFSNANTVNSSVSNLSLGIYGFELTVTDNQNGIAKDTMLANVSATVTEGSQRRVLIDAGPPTANGGVLTPSPAFNGLFWNNITDARVGNRLSNAKTTVNGISSIGLDVINRIDGTFNTGGNGMNNVNNMGAVGDYPASATNDYAFTHNSATNGRWRITGLETDKVYSIKFWGSKSGETRERDVEIKRSDESIWKSYAGASNTNFNNAAFFTVTGKTSIDFDIRAKAPSIFGYINVIDISWTTTTSPPTNVAPVANAGVNISLLLPTAATSLNGCASADPENAPLQFKWTKISGPANVTISDDAICNPALNNLAAGTYIYELLVTDTGNLSSKDTVAIVVNNASLAWPVWPAPICPAPYRIVTLGSSTTAGTGATPLDSSWVNKLRLFTQQQNASVVITNLGVGGYNSFHVNPTGFVPPAGRPAPDVTKNITAALALNPDAIIINLPTNDAASAFPISETQNNFNSIIAAADAARVPVWVTTSQPRNNLSAGQTNSLFELRDWVNQRFGNKAIDCWTNLANPDGTIQAFYNSGDGVHLNNQGHHLIFTRTVQESIWDSICIRRNNLLNQLPIANAGVDVYSNTVSAPILLNGTASTDVDGIISTYGWRIIQNIGTAFLTNASTAQPSLNNAVTGSYQIELTVTDNRQGSAKDTVSVWVSLPNVAPNANAGTDQQIQLPINQVLLNGRGSTDVDGSIQAYAWNYVNGPVGGTLASPNSESSLLILANAGIYVYRLTVTDNGGRTASDDIQITVLAAPVTGKSLNINIYDANFTFNDPSWNNWKPIVNVNSANFKYEDGTQSLVNANLSVHDRFSDNGAAYGSGSLYCPPQVLRFNSIHTIPRTLTLRGLNPAKKYHFEFYGARAFTSNSRSIFRVGNIADTINTDFNINDVARLNNLTPDNTGRIVFTLSFIGTYHYMAGFKIIEPGGSTSAGRSNGYNPEAPSSALTALASDRGEAVVYPNPFSSQINLNIRELPIGLYLIQVTDAAGKLVLLQRYNKLPGASTNAIQSGFLKPGLYFLQLVGATHKKIYKIIKL